MQVTRFLWLKLGTRERKHWRAQVEQVTDKAETKSFRTTLRSPDALRNTAPCLLKLSRTFGKYVLGHLWLSRAWDKETFRQLAGKEYSEQGGYGPQGQHPGVTNRAGHIQDEGSCSGQLASLCEAKSATRLAKIPPIASLLEVR